MSRKRDQAQLTNQYPSLCHEASTAPLVKEELPVGKTQRRPRGSLVSAKLGSLLRPAQKMGQTPAGIETLRSQDWDGPLVDDDALKRKHVKRLTAEVEVWPSFTGEHLVLVTCRYDIATAIVTCPYDIITPPLHLGWATEMDRFQEA